MRDCFHLCLFAQFFLFFPWKWNGLTHLYQPESQQKQCQFHENTNKKNIKHCLYLIVHVFLFIYFLVIDFSFFSLVSTSVILLAIILSMLFILVDNRSPMARKASSFSSFLDLVLLSAFISSFFRSTISSSSSVSLSTIYFRCFLFRICDHL
jgi:hypothetical protein